MNEEDALIEEQAFMENLTKAELRESRALCSSLRIKLKYYGDEIARLRCEITQAHEGSPRDLPSVLRSTLDRKSVV